MIDIGKMLDPIHFNSILDDRWKKFHEDYSHAPNKEYFISTYNSGLSKEIQIRAFQAGLSQLIPEIQNKLELDDRITPFGMVEQFCKENNKDFNLIAEQIAEIKALEELYGRVQQELSRKTDIYIVPDTVPKQILIKGEFIISIARLLRNYFADNSLDELINVLSGKQVFSKLIFHSNANKFTDLFWKLSQPNLKIVISSRTVLVNWICDNFQFIRENKATDFDLDNVRKSILSQNSNCANPIPEIEQLISSNNNK